MPDPTVTISLQNGTEVTGHLADWVGALIVSLPAPLRDQVVKRVADTVRGPIIGGPRPSGVLVRPGMRPPGLKS